MADKKTWKEQLRNLSNEFTSGDKGFDERDYAEVLGKGILSEDERREFRTMNEARNRYLESDSMMLTLYLLAGLSFRITDRCKGDVAWYLTTRIKSFSSSFKKKDRFARQKREGIRENTELHDVVACNLVIEDILGEKEGLKSFSSAVKSRYDERDTNLDLLAGIIGFFNEQYEIDNFYSQYDKKDFIDEKLKVLKKSFNDDFGKHIYDYRKDYDPSNRERPQLEEHLNRIIKKLKDEYKTDTEFCKKAEKIRTGLIREQTNLQDERDYQEEYYKYLIVLLYRLKNLEYVECTNAYKEIEDALKRTLMTFADLMEIGFNDNVTLENIEELEKWCKKLNAQLNDRLASQIILELFSETMFLEFGEPNLSVSMQEKNNDTLDFEFKKKSNEYVALHATIVQEMKNLLQIFVECKGTTQYRAYVATYGNASYGEKRLGKYGSQKETLKEKRRPINIIPKYESKKHKFKDEDHDVKRAIVIEGYGKIDEMSEQSFARWKREIQRVTPKYINIAYNKETDSIDITFHSLHRNARMYFSEINNRRQKHIVEEGFKIIEERKLLDDTEKTISLSRKQYKKFVQGGGLDKLVNSVLQLYGCNEKNNKKEGPSLDD